jgi:hypothetical protein
METNGFIVVALIIRCQTSGFSLKQFRIKFHCGICGLSPKTAIILLIRDFRPSLLQVAVDIAGEKGFDAPTQCGLIVRPNPGLSCFRSCSLEATPITGRHQRPGAGI